MLVRLVLDQCDVGSQDACSPRAVSKTQLNVPSPKTPRPLTDCLPSLQGGGTVVMATSTTCRHFSPEHDVLSQPIRKVLMFARYLS